MVFYYDKEEDVPIAMEDSATSGIGNHI